MLNKAVFKSGINTLHESLEKFMQLYCEYKKKPW